MKRPHLDARLQGQRDGPPDTSSQRKEMEKLEAQLRHHETRMRKLSEGENAGHVVSPKGWLETRRG
jgi:hypothetical protein